VHRPPYLGLQVTADRASSVVVDDVFRHEMERRVSKSRAGYGCQHSTGSRSGAGTRVISFNV